MIFNVRVYIHAHQSVRHDTSKSVVELEWGMYRGELKEHFCPEGLFRPAGINVTVLQAGERLFRYTRRTERESETDRDRE